jgi:hypothetical protein
MHVNLQNEVIFAYGLTGLVLNSDTIHDAARQIPPVDLWRRAQTDQEVSIILLSPELLRSDKFEALLQDDAFWNRIYVLGVDECHLLLTWGKNFRKPFRQIRLVRARLPDRAILMALTATMRGGPALKSVSRFMALRDDNESYVIRRSNLRNDIKMTYREITSPVTGDAFPELDWTLSSQDPVIIFCRTIAFGNRVLNYLHKKAEERGKENIEILIRAYNAVNWASYNEETRHLVTTKACRVVIGTSMIAVGVDIPSVRTVVIFGDPTDMDELLQMVGRIRVVHKDGAIVPGRAVIYLNPKSVERAERAIEEAQKKGNGVTTLAENNNEREMDVTIARMVLANCKIKEQDDQYDNPLLEEPCTCLTCSENPRPPRPSPCNCCGCRPEEEDGFGLISDDMDVAEEGSSVALPLVFEFYEPAREVSKPKLVGKKRKFGVEQLEKLRMEIYDQVDSYLLPPEFYLSDSDIKLILDHIWELTSEQAVSHLITDMETRKHSLAIFARVVSMQATFNAMDDEAKLKRREKEKERRQAKKNKSVGGQRQMEDDEGEEDEEETDDEGEAAGEDSCESDDGDGGI